MQMYLGEIRMFGGNFAPRAWALCNGQLLPISQNQALFSILGTTYGGDGRTTFALPDLRGRCAVHEGTGPGLSPRPLGQRSGQETVTLNQTQIPSHQHFFIPTSAHVKVTDATGTTDEAVGHVLASAVDASNNPVFAYTPLTVPAGQLGGLEVTGTLTPTGGGNAHNNMMPYQTINYIIALQGLFPSRS